MRSRRLHNYRTMQRVLLGALCLSMSLSIFREINDWQITGKWAGMAVFLWGLLILLLLQRGSITQSTHKFSLDIGFFMLFSNFFLSTFSILQLLGLINNISCFRGVGDFDNPAGVVSFLAFSNIFAYNAFYQFSEYKKRLGIVFLTTLNLIVIYSIGSRTGIIVFCAILMMGIILDHPNISRNALIVSIGIVLISIIMLIMLFSAKHSSTVGRKTILLICFEMMKEKPLIGFGFHGFSSNYMNYQSSYLRAIESDNILLLSDNITHPLNEFVRIAVNYGLAGMGIVATLCMLYVKRLSRISQQKQSSAIFFMTTLFLLSLFSYPFKYPITFISVLYLTYILWQEECVGLLRNRTCRYCLLAFVTVAPLLFLIWFTSQLQWKTISDSSERLHYGLEESIDSLQKSIERADRTLYRNSKYRYSRAVANYYMQDYCEAMEDLNYCKGKRWDYNSELLLGNIYFKTNETRNAELHFMKAAEMCPSKITPLFSLFVLYELTGDTNQMIETGKQVLSLPIKVNSSEIRAMRFYVRKKCPYI